MKRGSTPRLHERQAAFLKEANMQRIAIKIQIKIPIRNLLPNCAVLPQKNFMHNFYCHHRPFSL